MEKEVKTESFWKKNKTVIITAGVTLLVIMVILGALAIGLLKYYIGGSINRRAIDAPLRSILWEKPHILPGRLNHVRNNRDASISSDGRLIVLAHEYSDDNFDLYSSHLIDEEWTQQEPIKEINTRYNEKGPEISNDKQFLFFSSDRPGGFGGYDIWYCYRDGTRWSRPVNMGNSINTAANERDPSISPDSKKFFFSSDRPFSNEDANKVKTDFDIYMATVPTGRIDTEKHEIIPKPPPFMNPVNLIAVNSSFDEGKAVLTPRGNTIYFSSDRPGGTGGYDLYRSLLVNGKFSKPKNFGTPINSPFDEINPTMTLEGFGIYFSSNRRSRNPNDYQVFKSTSREVMMKFDYAMLVRLVVGLLGVLFAILAVYLLLKFLLSDTRMKLIWKCLLAAVVLHLIFLILCAFWFFASSLAEKLNEAPKEMTINVNNLARESIAMAIRESTASLPKVQTTSVAEKLPIPAQKPVSNTSTPSQHQEATVAKNSIAPISMKTVQDVSGEPPKGVQIPALKPFQAGANIKMDSPPSDNAGIASPTSGSASEGIPMPKTFTKMERPPIPKMKLDAVPLNMNIVQIEDPNQTVLDKNNAAPPSAVNSLRQANRIIDSPAGKNPVNEAFLAANAAPVLTGSQSMGTLIFSPRIKMDEKKTSEMKKSPKLGLLLKDSNITGAIDLTIQNDKVAERKLNDLVKAYIKRNKLKFNSFEVVRFLIAERKLKRVGSLVYKNMNGLNLPTDSELEVPEKYNK